jgi:hypothetical protein
MFPSRLRACQERTQRVAGRAVPRQAHLGSACAAVDPRLRGGENTGVPPDVLTLFLTNPDGDIILDVPTG